MAETKQDNAEDLEIGDRLADLLMGFVRGMVDQPDTVNVEIDEDGATIALRLYVAAEDLDTVIGKQGRTARSLRTVLNAIAGKSQHRVSLDVLEDGEDEEDESDGDAS